MFNIEISHLQMSIKVRKELRCVYMCLFLIQKMEIFLSNVSKAYTSHTFMYIFII